MTSLTMTVVAESGPALVAVTVHVNVDAVTGVAVLAVFVSATFACCGVTVMLALLFAEAGSNKSELLMAAVLVDVFGLTTVATMVSVCGAPFATVPTVQMPDPLS